MQRKVNARDALQAINMHFSEEELIAFLSRTIQLPSHWEHAGQEREVAEYIRDFLKGNGLEATTVNVKDDRPNVICTLEGGQPGPWMLYNGHTDTIPPFEWADAFSGAVVDGKIYGRGASDMKSGVCAMAYALVVLKRSGLKFPGKITFAGVIAEEFSGSYGTQSVVKGGNHYDMAIVAEPTDLNVAVCHRGQEYMRATFVGRSIHSSVADKGNHAIYRANEFINALIGPFATRLKTRTHSQAGQSSVHVGVIRGGTAPNVVPALCEVDFERRYLPGEALADVYREIEDVVAGLGPGSVTANISTMRESVECKRVPLLTPPDSILVRQLREAIRLVLGCDPDVGGVAFWTDAALLGAVGVPTVVCGPGHVDQAHSANEYARIDSVVGAAKVFSVLPLSFS